MIPSATAMLALWNACGGDIGAYNEWHTREHVPERLMVDGFLAARRYVRTDGPLPAYLTLYALSGIGVLSSDAYLELLRHPSDRSRAMRARLTEVMRRGCDDLRVFGRGVGGDIAIKLVRWDEHRVAAVAAVMADGMIRGITGATLARFAPEVPLLPFATSPFDADADADALLLIEGFDGALLHEGTRELSARLELERDGGWTSYRLAFLAERNDGAATFHPARARAYAGAS